MKSLNIISSVSASLLVAGAFSQAAPMVSLGDNVSLFINSNAGLEYNSNLYRASDGQNTIPKESDTAMIFQPGIEIDFGTPGSASSNVLKVGYKIFQYFDVDALNTELVKSSFVSRYDSGVYLFRGEASYNEFGTSLAASPDNLGSILDPVVTERSETRLGGSLKYRFSDRLAVSGGINYLGRAYDNATLTDLARYDVPLRVFYNIAPRLDAVVGYRYREVNNNRAGAPEYADHYFFVGLDGEIFNPLWRIALDLGIQEREYQNSGIDTDDSFTASARVTYQADNNRSYFLSLSRDYSTSPGGAVTYIQDQVVVGMNYQVSEMWTVSAALAASTNDYQNVGSRKEDLIFGQLGVSYAPNEYLTFSGQVRYIAVDGSGSSSAIDYDQQVVSVSASFRY